MVDSVVAMVISSSSSVSRDNRRLVVRSVG
jgi:hypothetical protein